ncbi:PEP-CTERM sorting domain-containing protein [Cylindrospermum sp. FACHB-282]|uniref:PEP-CTERM sorting domain-containing protein n=1 Tax=Cylindrospermum sp. FACHB-282 TaxID=2692794 RepID=UPI001686065A|nr:PEP-CTERM sorting domain-containing protein [Cylindrospermum sp. FACHB-282]MBD2388084.1 PEP-CTERM sorting domain-containing protein [Cylindrospermum sp. FACHB-282]
MATLNMMKQFSVAAVGSAIFVAGSLLMVQKQADAATIGVFGSTDGTSTVNGSGYVANQLANLGLFDAVKVLNGNENAATLARYDAILFYTNGGADLSYFGNKLADYVDAGGKLVVSTFAYQTSYFHNLGRLVTDGYLPFQNYQGNYYNVTLGRFNPNHPIMQGPLSIKSVGGYYHDKVDLTLDAELVASWSDGSPFIAVDRGSKVVGITLFPKNFSPIISGASGDYNNVFGNALYFAANQSNAPTVPEPSTIVGSAIVLGFGSFLKRKSFQKQAKNKSKVSSS